MKPNIDTLKKKFREGLRAEAIAECEALCAQETTGREVRRLCASMHALVQNYGRALELLQQIRDPANEDADILFNVALCERELKKFQAAAQSFRVFTEKFPGQMEGWASLAECTFQLHGFEEGVKLADRAIQLEPSCREAWMVRGNCQKSLGKLDDALASYQKAHRIAPAGDTFLNTGLALLDLNKPAEAVEQFGKGINAAPQLAALRIARGDALQSMGKIDEAVADYLAGLTLAPGDDPTLKRVTMWLLQAGRGEQAIELCRKLLKVHPGNLTARLGAEWLLSQLVPLWHVPMMNEPERNRAYEQGMASVVAPDKLVLEIGTGSGLLAMMAARLGAKEVVTCEAVGVIAATARKIVQRNGLQDRVKVLAMPSHAIQLGADLPGKADILVHEIFSSELLGEHVLPAIEDAKARLLKEGAKIVPCAASIMIALVGGDDLGRTLIAGETFGFDLSDFNEITPKKRPLFREDLAPMLLSSDTEAFRFDFEKDNTFPPERKELRLTATRGGLCHGVIQWIRLELGEGIVFENHPSATRALSNWQHTIYSFAAPVALEEGAVISIAAMHDRSRPWFERK